MLRRSIVSEGEETTEINLSSMIDCIFILLIFFIVTTVFVEESGIQINKPDASEAPPPPDEEITTIVFEITSDNKVMHEGTQIGVKGVAAQVRQKMTREEVPVSIRSHEKSDHGLFMTVWDEVQLAGAKKISFSTEN